MERYKKRTILLCLASMLTVVGSFAEDYYNNTLMALKIDSGSGGNIKVTTYTKKPYNTPIETSKINENTYVITLPKTNSDAVVPNIEDYDNINSIKISTYPYTPGVDAHTKILVRTNGEAAITATNALYISDTQSSSQEHTESENNENQTEEFNTNNQEANYSLNSTGNTVEQNNSENTFNTDASQVYVPTEYKSKSNGNSIQVATITLYLAILLFIIGIIYKFGKEKMASVVGNQEDFNIYDEEGNEQKADKKQNKTKKLKPEKNKVNSPYTKKQSFSDLNYNKTNEYSGNNSGTDTYVSTEEEAEEENNIVDLDMLYQESQNNQSVNKTTDNTDNEQDDLADLLNSFLLETEEKTEEIPENEPFDEETYNQVINSNTLNFSDSDIQKIKLLLQVEITPETMEKVKKYLSTPVKKPPTQEQILEDLLSTYSISQRINFSSEDVETIKKLMSVELDPDFVKDFTTNPLRTKIVAKTIKENAGKKPQRVSNILTLSVKDMLPDLSAELKKQGGKRIQSEVKPTVVYFSEGYEYKKLSVSSEISELKFDSQQNEYKPSYEDPFVASGYEVSTLSIKDELPDLADVKANPNKYKETSHKETADEDTLLKSIENVTFKPFYEESNDEITQTDNIEFSNNYENNDNIIQIDNIRFDDIVENNNETEQVFTNSELTVPVLKTDIPSTNRNDENTKKLLKLIEEQQNERTMRKKSAEEEIFRKELETTVKKQQPQAEEKTPETTVRKQQPQTGEKTPETSKPKGQNTEVIKSIRCTENSICRMIRTENKYKIIGNIEGKNIVLKEYSLLKNADMQIRLNDKTDKTKFLVKIGMHKFIIKITADNMEFVMDLC